MPRVSPAKEHIAALNSNCFHSPMTIEAWEGMSFLRMASISINVCSETAKPSKKPLETVIPLSLEASRSIPS
ncbi:MAG: hypothetical protein V3S97_04155 [Candidatus Bathyarchaeia archaeon]